MLGSACLAAVVWSAGASAQSVRIYSEFQRIDPFGQVVRADRAAEPDMVPREILSPAVARNGFASFHVAVTAPRGVPFTLHVGQNPEDTFVVTVYRELFVRLGDSWIPDRLDPVTLPYTAQLPEAPALIPGQTTAVFWMDLWVPRECETGRMRAEVQVNVQDSWIIYPMEVRVLRATIPRPAQPRSGLSAAGDPADASTRGVLLASLCGGGERARQEERRSVREFIRRNALQDVALAPQLESEYGKMDLSSLLSRVVRVSGALDWCGAPPFPKDLGAEWYLRVRDTLYRMVN